MEHHNSTSGVLNIKASNKRKKEFSFIAGNGDWPDCFRVNKYIKCSESHGNAFDVLHSFNRWPTWMWANREMVELVEWLKSFNDHNTTKTIISLQKELDYMDWMYIASGNLWKR